jgi:amidophosphoribosyltransferase
MKRLRGAYSTVVMTESAVVAFAIPPACGRSASAGSTTGTWRLRELRARHHRRRAPPGGAAGELISLGPRGMETRQAVESERVAACVFEHIYFSRPDSKLEGRTLQSARGRMGEILAREAPVDADLVISVPDSGNAAPRASRARPASRRTTGLIKNRYVARTFIQPGQELRRHGLRMKFNPLPDVVAASASCRGRLDRARQHDAPDRRMLREAGAKEVHCGCPRRRSATRATTASTCPPARR